MKVKANALRVNLTKDANQMLKGAAGFDTLTLVGRSIFADCFFADRCGHAATVASSQA